MVETHKQSETSSSKAGGADEHQFLCLPCPARGETHVAITGAMLTREQLYSFGFPWREECFADQISPFLDVHLHTECVAGCRTWWWRGLPGPPLANDVDKNTWHKGNMGASHVGVGKYTILEHIGSQSWPHYGGRWPSPGLNSKSLITKPLWK